MFMKLDRCFSNLNVMSHSDESLGSSYPLLRLANEDQANRKPRIQQHESSKRPFLLAVAFCCALVLFLTIGFVIGAKLACQKPQHWGMTVNGPRLCVHPQLRREWRSLSRQEKRSYISAVQCLKTMPSQLALNQTLYDDFPWVHKHFGEYSHDAAPFLAWHRYFIHSYERSLQQWCGYRGTLPYWDWTLDWENITTSPIWAIDTGFGGNGNTSHGAAVFQAYCVTEGPFAYLHVPYFENIYRPHCLLRGFDQNLTNFRDALKPESLQDLLLSQDYDKLNLGLENGPHVAIPKSINGDFSLHTAPFGIHHHLDLKRGLLLIEAQIQSFSFIIHNWTVCGGGGSRWILT